MIYFIFFLFFCIASCGFDALKLKLLASIPLDENILNYPKQNGVYHEIPGKIGIEDERIIISEPSSRIIKIFYEGKLERIIKAKDYYSDPNNADNTKIPAEAKETFISELGIPGMISTTSDESFYVLNYISQEKSQKSSNHNDEGAYNILHIDFEGKLKGVIVKDTESILKKSQKIIAPLSPSELKIQEIQNTYNAADFSDIQWMDVDDADRLWVLYGNEQEIFLEAYEKNKRIHKFSKEDCYISVFKSYKESRDEELSCEVFYPFGDGKSLLLIGKIEGIERKSDDLDDTEYFFKERVFKVFEIQSKVVKKVFNHQSEPQESPYLPYKDDGFIIWVTKDYNNFILELYNITGDLKNKYQLSTEGTAHSWRNTYTTIKGDIYSIRVFKDSLMVYNWN